MAKFILEEEKSEEHTHVYETKTELLEGTADFVMNEKRVSLKLNEVIAVPANTRHTVINTGSGPVVFNCWC